MTTPADGVIDKNPSSALADIVETVLDKGVVIDAQISVDVVGIRLLDINARVVIASIETYLRFAQAVDRLDIRPPESQGLPDIVEGVTGGGALSGITGAAKGVLGSAGEAASEAVGGAAGRALGSGRERPRRRSDREEG